jgi:iron complex transport system substrate-binding protein
MAGRIPRRAALAGLALVAAACHQDRAAAARVDRVISLSPSTTETLFALGALGRLVGRSRFCDFPPAVARIPIVGGFVDPSFEAILGLVPDLVLGVRGPGGRALHDRLNARGIATYFPPTDSMHDIESMVRGVAARLGDDAAAGRVVGQIAQKRASIVQALANVSRPRALLLFGLRPIVAAGTEGFAGEVLRLAGARNAVSSGTRYPTLAIEQVLALDPDVVIDATGAATHDGEGFSGELPGWRELRAVKRGKLIHVRDERVLRPGPRVAEGLAALARLLHPQVQIPA